MPSLWRNGVLLGQILELPPGKQRRDPVIVVHGQFKPAPAFAGMQPMVQTRNPMLPHNPTFQHVMPRSVIDTAPSQSSSVRKEVELTPMTPEEARGVSPDKLLEIRADDGAVLDLDSIWLHCFVIPDAIPLAEIQRRLGTTDDTREAWSVSGHRHDATSRPR